MLRQIFTAVMVKDEADRIAAIIDRLVHGDRICKAEGCGKVLAPQNRCGYCKRHRHKSAKQKLQVKKARMQ